MEDNFDREYYIAALCDKFNLDNIDEDVYLNAFNKAIDKTLEDYTINGELLVEDYDMFDQDLYTYAFNELNAMEGFEFTFENGVYIKIVVGEDGYTVNIADDDPKMGTFTSFEGLLYAIAPIVQDNVNGKEEFIAFAEQLTLSLSNVMTIDEIEEILLK